MSDRNFDGGVKFVIRMGGVYITSPTLTLTFLIFFIFLLFSSSPPPPSSIFIILFLSFSSINSFSLLFIISFLSHFYFNFYISPILTLILFNSIHLTFIFIIILIFTNILTSTLILISTIISNITSLHITLTYSNPIIPTLLLVLPLPIYLLLSYYYS